MPRVKFDYFPGSPPPVDPDGPFFAGIFVGVMLGIAGAVLYLNAAGYLMP